MFDFKQIRNDSMHDEYALTAFKFFLTKYFDKDFEELAADSELDVNELVACLSLNLADAMMQN